MSFRTSLRVKVFDTYTSSRVLLDELSGEFEALRFSTRLNGGFKDAFISVQMPVWKVWQYLAIENQSRGRHFAHVEITEEERIVWEGRLMGVGYDPSGASLRVDLEALGYWSACRDQWYDDEDSGNTDWAAAGSGTAKDIIAEMLTNACPDINTDQAGLGDPSNALIPTTGFHTRKYVQDHILDTIPLSGTSGEQWYFAIWENRLPYLKARDLSTLHWRVSRWDLAQGSRLHQDATAWRNNVLPVIGTTEGTASAGSRPTGVPQRDLIVTLATAIPSAAGNDERDRLLTERNQAQQSQRFNIKGSVVDSNAAFAEVPKWRVRAGEVLRITDLVPVSVPPTITLDNLRTFFILETTYDAALDLLTITPDRVRLSLSAILPKLGQLEAAK